MPVVRVGKIACSLAVVSLLGLVPVGAESQGPRPNVEVRHWGVEDGLPQGSVTSIAQTVDGFLWLGTFGGLVRFDGLSPRTQPGAPTEKGTNFRVTALVADPSGGLWVGLQGGGISRHVNGRWTRPVQPEVLASATVWQIGMGDRPWAATDVGIATWNGSQFELQERAGVAVVLVQGDTVWIGSGTGLSRVRDGRLEAIFSERPVSAMAVGRHGLWVAGDRWVGHWTGDELQLVAELAPRDHPWALAVDSAGSVWLASDSGLYSIGTDGDDAPGPLLAPVRWSALRAGARSVFRDREGNLWAGANGDGLYRLRRDLFERRHLAEGRGPSAGGVVGDAGGIVVSGECRELFRVQGAVVTTLPEVEGDHCVGALALDDRRHLWIGAGPALIEYALEADSLVELSRRSVGAPIAALAAAPDKIWVGTLGKGLGSVGHGARWYTVDDGLAHSHVSALVVQGDTVWAGHPSGTTIVRAEGLHGLTEADGHPPGTVRALLPDADDAVWIGTYGGGLSRWHRGHFLRVTRADGLVDDVVSSIVDDGVGALWMNGNRGVFWVARSELEAFASGRIQSVRVPSLATGEGNGFVQPTGWRSPAGVLSFPTVDGLVQVRPAAISANATVPTVFVESATLDGVGLTLGATTTLPPGDGELVARFTSPSLRRPELVRFHYRLGRDGAGTWTEAVGRGVHLRHLAPGNYTLAVRATNEDDVVSSTVVLRFELQPALHQTLWFKLLLVLALVTCGVILQMFRTRRLARHAAALRDEIEQRKAAEVALRDEAERRLRLERQLAQAARMEAIGTLAGGVAHDFNNLLTVINNYAALLHREVQPAAGSTVEGYIGEISRCAERAARLTRQLLAFGRRQFLQPVACSPAAVIEGLSPVLRRLGPRGVDLTLAVDPDAGHVLADPAGLENALVNLVLNAAQAQGDVASVHIAVGRVDGDPPGVVIEVGDKGPGIPADVLPHIFEPFYTTKAVGEGTGLGLASAHGFVSQSAGEITVRSGPDGTVFRIVLPWVAAPVVGSPAPAPQARPRSILLVDDDHAVRRSLRRLLRGRGFVVLEAASGEEALAVLMDDVELGAIVTDVRMPGMSGVEFAERASGLRPDLKVLFISGHVTPALVDQLSHHGGHLLEKPFEPELLVARVEELLG